MFLAQRRGFTPGQSILGQRHACNANDIDILSDVVCMKTPSGKLTLPTAVCLQCSRVNLILEGAQRCKQEVLKVIPLCETW